MLGPIPRDGKWPPQPLLVRAGTTALIPDIFSHKQLERRMSPALRNELTAPLETLQPGWCMWSISQFGKLQFYVRAEPGWRLFEVERADWPEVTFYHNEPLAGQKHSFGALVLGAQLAGAR